MKKRSFMRIIAMVLATCMVIGHSSTVFAEEVKMKETTRSETVNEIRGVNSQTFCAGVTSGAVLEDGSLYTWGQNIYGTVGNGKDGLHGNNNNQLTPTRILSNVKSIHYGNFYGGAVTENGDLYMWGYNVYGQIGNGTTNNQLTPKKVLSNVVSVQLKSLHSAAITEDGSLYMWGWNGYGQIGNGTTVNQTTPVKVLTDVATVSVGRSHSAAITEDGSLYMWGMNFAGQVGNGTAENNQLTPVKILSNVISVALGDEHSAAITEDGSLYLWGSNAYGKIGNGTKTNQLIPQKVLSNVEFISMESDSSAAITEDGSLYMWGHGYNGRLGNGQKDFGECQVTPIKILSNVATVELAYSHSAAITEDGNLYLWGDNEAGTIGNGEADYRNPQSIPKKVLSDIAGISINNSTCLAVRTDGSLYAWGNNTCGQVGNGTAVHQLKPVKIFSGVRLPEMVQIENPNVNRIAGATRYQTSSAIADAIKIQQNIEQFDTVILTDGKNFPDALAGSYLAGKLNAPILMANAKEKYAEPLREYIRENLKAGGDIYILGGTNAVPDSILEGLWDYNIKRLSGVNRYETNLLILEEAGVTDESILICTGKGFADSLSASATKLPILLVNNKKLTDEQKVFLEMHSDNPYYIIGGESAISQNMENEIEEYGITKRLSGANRYETSLKVAEEFFENSEAAVLASAKNFPDGLCGGPLAMSMNAPLILTAIGKTNQAEAYVNENNIIAGMVLGGEKLISNQGVNRIF